jgi:hypothetical protein
MLVALIVQLFFHDPSKNVPFTQVKTLLFVVVSGDLVVYVHTNRLIYRQREEWLKGKTNMWDVFLDDMGFVIPDI